MKILSTILCSIPLMAQVIITPQSALKAVYGEEIAIDKKRVLLKGEEAAAVQKHSHGVLQSKLITLYEVGGKTGAYAILLSRKIRTKTATVLYMIDSDGTLRAAEIIAFNEPPEYLPGASWMKQFEHVGKAGSLQVGSGVSVITGATLSARSIAEGARLAMAIVALLKP